MGVNHEGSMGARSGEAGRVYRFPANQELRRMARELLQNLAELVPFDVGLAFLREHGSEEPFFLAAYPEDCRANLGKGVTLPVAQSVFQKQAKKAEAGDPLSPFFIGLASSQGLRHFDVFDINAGGHRTLFLILGDRGEDRGRFRPPDTVSEVAKESLSRLTREVIFELNRSDRHLQALIDVSRILADETDPERLMQRVLGIVERLMGSRTAYVMLLDPSDRTRLRGVAVRLGEELIKLETGMRNALYRKAREKGLDNLISAMEGCVTPGVVREGAVLLEIPIRLEGELLGMIKCALRESNVEERDLEFLRALAAQLAAGIKISDHYRKLREREEALSALNALLSDLSECLFREEMEECLVKALTAMLEDTETLLLWTSWDAGDPSVAFTLWGEEEEASDNAGLIRLVEGMLAEARRLIIDSGKWALFRKQDLVDICGGREESEEMGVQEAFIFPVYSAGTGEAWSLTLSHREGRLDSEFLLSIADSLVEAVQSSFLRASFYEEALKEEGKLTAVFDAMQDAVMVVDEEGKLLAANRVADRLFGFRMKGVVGRKLREDDVYSALYRFIFDPGAGERSCEEMTVPVEPPRYVRAYKTDVRLPAGESVGQVIVIRDVTEEKEVEVLKDDFLACVSHELRTPLSIVLGYLEVLNDSWDRLDEFTRYESLRHACRAAGKLKGVITDILDTAKARRRELALRRSLMRLDSIAEEVAKQAQVSDGDRVYKFVRMPGSSLCFADETKIKRVLWNLLDNARKFSPPETEVTVTVGRRSDGVFLSVRDRGIGISQWHMPLIFRRFSQVDHGDARRSQGLGIGLYLVSEIVELHGGKLEVRSEPGRGSVFTVILPPADEEWRKESAPVTETAGFGDSAERALL